MVNRLLTTHEALLYVLDPRHTYAYDVMGDCVQSEYEGSDGVTLNEVAIAFEEGTFDEDVFASYGPFVLVADEDPGPAQPATVEDLIYVGMEAGPSTETPATTIKRIVTILRTYGFLAEVAH